MEIACDLRGPAPMLDPRPGHASTQTGKSKGMTRTLEVPVDIPEASHPCPKNVPMFLEALLQNKTNRKPTCRIFSRVCGEVVARSVLKILERVLSERTRTIRKPNTQHKTRQCNAFPFSYTLVQLPESLLRTDPGRSSRFGFKFFLHKLSSFSRMLQRAIVSFGSLPGALLR